MGYILPKYVWITWVIIISVVCTVAESSDNILVNHMQNPQQQFLHESYRKIYTEKFRLGDVYLERMTARIDRLTQRYARDEAGVQALSHLNWFVARQKGHLSGAVVLPDQAKRMHKNDFLAIYWPYVTSSLPLPERCFEGYAQLDELARNRNFPTSLLLASWYKESGCNLQNPWNGDGLFQIVAHDYGAGAVSIQELLEQAEHFIDFSNAKRERYKKLLRFDDVPLQITYEGWSLQDIRKHAVLYNGMAAGVTLENSRYANNWFAGYSRPDISSQDGLVTLLLKVLAQEYLYHEKIYAWTDL